MLKEKIEGTSSSKSPSGLGKKLGGILRFSDFSRQEKSSADQLLGAPRQKTNRRQHILDLAMNAIAESYAASAVILARRSESEVTNFSSIMPDAWDDTSKVKFQFLGRVWSELHGYDPQSSTTDISAHYQLSSSFQWVGVCAIDDVCLAASVVRSTKLTAKEEVTLQSLFTSLAASLSNSTQFIPTDVAVQVAVEKKGALFEAEVILKTQEVTVIHVSEGEDEAVSIVKAATLFCRKDLKVVQAAKLFLDRQFLYLVVVAFEGAPFIGIVLSGEDDPARFVEAVFIAASAAGVAPDATNSRSLC